jgi:hypothetical protein
MSASRADSDGERRIVVDDEDHRAGFDHGTLASPTGSVN